MNNRFIMTSAILVCGLVQRAWAGQAMSQLEKTAADAQSAAFSSSMESAKDRSSPGLDGSRLSATFGSAGASEAVSAGPAGASHSSLTSNPPNAGAKTLPPPAGRSEQSKERVRMILCWGVAIPGTIAGGFVGAAVATGLAGGALAGPVGAVIGGAFGLFLGSLLGRAIAWLINGDHPF